MASAGVNASEPEVDAEVHHIDEVHWTDAENVKLVNHVINGLTKAEVATLCKRCELPTNLRRLREIYKGIEKVVPERWRVDVASSDTDSDAGVEAGGAATACPPEPLEPMDQATRDFIDRMEARIQAFPAPPPVPPRAVMTHQSGAFMRYARYALLPPPITAHTCTSRLCGEACSRRVQVLHTWSSHAARWQSTRGPRTSKPSDRPGR
jgi:hypothetical protein